MMLCIMGLGYQSTSETLFLITYRPKDTEKLLQLPWFLLSVQPDHNTHLQAAQTLVKRLRDRTGGGGLFF